MRKVSIEHRHAPLPSPSLCSPKFTSTKMQNSRCRLGDGRCEKLTRHHLVPEHWFLRQPLHLRQVRNAHANIIPLCRAHHDLVESKHPVVRLEARRLLRATLTQEEITFAIQIRGRAWLDREYPSEFNTPPPEEALVERPRSHPRCKHFTPYDYSWPDASGVRCQGPADHDGPCSASTAGGFRVRWYPESSVRPSITRIRQGI